MNSKKKNEIPIVVSLNYTPRHGVFGSSHWGAWPGPSGKRWRSRGHHHLLLGQRSWPQHGRGQGQGQELCCDLLTCWRWQGGQRSKVIYRKMKKIRGRGGWRKKKQQQEEEIDFEVEWWRKRKNDKKKRLTLRWKKEEHFYTRKITYVYDPKLIDIKREIIGCREARWCYYMSRKLLYMIFFTRYWYLKACYWDICFNNVESSETCQSFYAFIILISVENSISSKHKEVEK